MDLPLTISLGSWTLSTHPLFEALAYAVGFRLYLRARRRRGDFLETGTRWTVVVAAILGAAVGSKLLSLVHDPALTLAHLDDPRHLIGGKTIVGGLLGGWIAVELCKRWVGIQRATGDLYALPLVVAIAIGRVGCFFAGVHDGTHGVPWSGFLALDLGDGIPRHPTQLYEIAFLLVLAPFVARVAARPPREGDAFKLFMGVYLAFRLAVDFLKPYPAFAGLATIQWACVIGLAVLARRLLPRARSAPCGAIS